MRRWPQLVLSFWALILLGACAAPAEPQIRAALSVSEAMRADDDPRFARATEPIPFTFPADHGPHPAFAIEWWYLTGNLQAADGRHFGFQLTIFRRALAPEPAERDSAWATRNIYMAHFALSDVAGGQFYAFERFSRDGAGLAGASAEPLRVFLEDWSIAGEGPGDATLRLRAAEGPVAIDLAAANDRPPVLQGDRGLSEKGPSAGNASYYYSLTRMATSGQIRVADTTYTVSGLSWMDREWSTSALEGGVIGWDWFALQLDSGHDLMLYQLRTDDGGISPYSKGSLVAPDGSVTPIAAADMRITPLGSWTSPRSGARYPSGWRLDLPTVGLSLELTPHLRDQELPTSVVYWEGAVRVAGDAAGHGYVELTGYD